MYYTLTAHYHTQPHVSYTFHSLKHLTNAMEKLIQYGTPFTVVAK